MAKTLGGLAGFDRVLFWMKAGVFQQWACSVPTVSMFCPNSERQRGRQCRVPWHGATTTPPSEQAARPLQRRHQSRLQLHGELAGHRRRWRGRHRVEKTTRFQGLNDFKILISAVRWYIFCTNRQLKSKNHCLLKSLSLILHKTH